MVIAIVKTGPLDRNVGKIRFFVGAASAERSFKPKQDKPARSVGATALRAAALHMIDVLVLSWKTVFFGAFYLNEMTEAF